jgi:thiol-disulfide isomerase/thioredoxin
MINNQFVKGFILFFIAIVFSGCITTGDPFSGLPPGIWRGVLYLDQGTQKILTGGSFDEKSEAQLPFNFEVIYDTPDSFHIEVINGTERILIDDIAFGLDRSTGRDSVEIEFSVYDSYIKGNYEEDAIEGEWIVRSKENYRIPFQAKHSKAHRFTDLKEPPLMDISGKWAVQLETESDSPYPAIGLFKQEGNHLTGTFLTEIGDYRYLEGTVQGDRIFLSVFDGAHSFLFEAKILPDQSISGIFRNGSHYKTYWSAIKDENASLADPYELTYLNEGFNSFDFNFETPEGQMISLADEAYEHKVKIVQIFGTWCPNCYDETRFLVDYLKENPNDQLAIVGLAFERQKNVLDAKKSISRYQERMQIPYPIVYAGESDKEKASEALPMINRVISYPTLIFIDRDNQVRKIHTGFSGPATPEYASFKEEFKALVNSLLAE